MSRLFSSLLRRVTGIPGNIETPESRGASFRGKGSGIQPDAGRPSVVSGSDHIFEGAIMTREESMSKLTKLTSAFAAASVGLAMMQFMVIQVIGLVLIFVFPQIALWLPTLIYGE